MLMEGHTAKFNEMVTEFINARDNEGNNDEKKSINKFATDLSKLPLESLLKANNLMIIKANNLMII